MSSGKWDKLDKSGMVQCISTALDMGVKVFFVNFAQTELVAIVNILKFRALRTLTKWHMQTDQNCKPR